MATSIDLVDKVSQLFAANSWPITEESREVFDGFCDIINRMSMDERDMLLNLTRDFLWINMSQFHSYIRPALAAAIRELLPQNRIFLVPLLKDADYDKTKSSKVIAYLVSGLVFKGLLPPGTEGIYLDNPKLLKGQRISSGDAVVAVDDFVGSGKSLRYAIRDIKFHAGYNVPIHSAVMVAMYEAHTKLLTEGFKIQVTRILPKGISANPRFDAKTQALYKELMLGIEKRLVVKPQYSFGYGQSEALLSFERAPNNTFPVYWAREETQKIRRKAPYIRL